MKPRHLLMGAALLVAAGFALFGDKSPSGAALKPAPPAHPANGAAVPARAAASVTTPKPAAVTILRLEDRAALVGVTAAGGDAFASHDWTPALKPVTPPPPPPPPPPSAPPLPFTFLGKAVSNGVWEVFLARGSETLIVRDKTVIDGVYRIDAIAPPGMTITYLPLNQVQQLNIGVLD